jgi:hypothetical protein
MKPLWRWFSLAHRRGRRLWGWVLASFLIGATPAFSLTCNSPSIQLDAPSVSGQTLKSINGVALPGGNSCYIQYITWTFGDSTAAEKIWFPAGPHAYLKGGRSYTIEATAHQNDNQTASASTTVTIQTSSPPAGATYIGIACYEDGSCFASEYYYEGVFHLGPTQVSGPSEPCTSLQYAGGTSVVDYIWNFLLGLAAEFGGLSTTACSITT